MCKENKMSIVVCLVAVFFLSLSGCTTPQKTVSSIPVPVKTCSLPSSKLVPVAFDEARATLSRSECISQFDSVFEALLVTAAGDPSLENKKRFSDFLTWTMQEGIIRKTDAKRLYTEYFSTKFASLPTDYSVCSYASQAEQINAELLKELVKKERGLMQVCGDKTGYSLAYNTHAKLGIILEATWHACGNGNGI